MFHRCTVPATLIAASLVAPLAAQAAEIVLHPSAVDASLRREVFNRNGRYVLSGDPRTCAWAGVDSPQSSFRDGRYFLRMRFQSSAAVLVNNQCVGGGDQFWMTISAEPFAQGETIGLRDARLEEGKEVYRPLIQLFLTNIAPSAIRLNLRDEVARMLTDPRNPYTVSVPMIAVQSLTVRENRLDVKFDFRLEAK